LDRTRRLFDSPRPRLPKDPDEPKSFEKIECHVSRLRTESESESSLASHSITGKELTLSSSKLGFCRPQESFDSKLAPPSRATVILRCSCSRATVAGQEIMKSLARRVDVIVDAVSSGEEGKVCENRCM
jgi:hypothetical protein